MWIVYADSIQVWLLIKGGLYAALKLDAKFLRVAFAMLCNMYSKGGIFGMVVIGLHRRVRLKTSSAV